jgi:hypothetical protein
VTRMRMCPECFKHIPANEPEGRCLECRRVKQKATMPVVARHHSAATAARGGSYERRCSLGIRTAASAERRRT